jgi:hypothetical protein
MNPASETIKLWNENPVMFVRDNFHAEPDLWQIKALEAVADPTKLRIALKACAGPGKSAVLAWIGWWFLATFGGVGEHPEGYAVSCTSDNLKDNLWKELAMWQGRSEYLKTAFTWSGSRIYANDHPETWWLSARSWPKTANEEEQGRTLSGLHAKYVLILIDESGDIPLPVLRAGEQAISNCAWGKIIQAGNPTSHTGMLYAAVTEQAELWFSISISADPDDPNRSTRISIDWAREQIKLYGRDNPWVMAYILGQFPLGDINSLIDIETVMAAQKRTIAEAAVEWCEKRIGVDVARFGDDRTFIARRIGLCCLSGETMRNARSNEIAARVSNMDAKWGGADQIFIDATGGWGSGVEDSLRQAKYHPWAVNFSGKADNPKYFNKRSEILFEFCEWIKRGGVLPDSPILAKELTTMTYTFQDGKFRVEEKAQIKARLKFSPDECDAYALTFALPDKPKKDIVDNAWTTLNKASKGHPWDQVSGEQGEVERKIPL